MSLKSRPDKEALMSTLTMLINIHPIKPSKPTSLAFIYIGLHEYFPGLVTYQDLTSISKRKKTAEAIAEAILANRYCKSA